MLRSGVISGLDVATLVVAVLALITSTTLAAIRIWETFLRRSKWDVHVDWIEHAGPPILTFTIANIGSRKYGVREIRFGASDTPAKEGWTPVKAVRARLPLLLEEGEISEAFYIATNLASTDEFDVKLREGRISWCAIVDSRRRETLYQVRPPGEANIQ
ncbi:MAG: hypothetical protein H0U16_02445 [Actinobacteria bacterium]|nr:hypothetical protein [Actinomycetota bacterium]